MTESIETTPPDASAPSYPEPRAPSPEPGESASSPRYLVGVMYYGAHDPQHDRCMHAIHPGKVREVGEIKELSGCAYIEIGRSLLATIVLDSDYDGLLMIDHDMLFEPEEVSRVIRDAHEHQAIVGGAYSMRSPGASIIGAIDTESLPEGEKVRFFEGGRVYPATYLGMGFTAIPKSALRKLAEGQPRLQTGIFKSDVIPFFSLLIRDTTWFGEDVSFCVRAHAADIPVLLDSRIRLHHRGMYDYGLEDCGTIVPYARYLEALIKDEPRIQHANYSHDPLVAAAIAARDSDAALPESLAP